MQFPVHYKYLKEHTWLKVLDNNKVLASITEFAQSELGKIVYVDLSLIGAHFSKDEVFGSMQRAKEVTKIIHADTNYYSIIHYDIISSICFYFLFNKYCRYVYIN